MNEHDRMAALRRRVDRGELVTAEERVELGMANKLAMADIEIAFRRGAEALQAATEPSRILRP